MKKEDIKKKKALSEDELLNVSGGMKPLGEGYGDNGACPGIKEKDECNKHEDGCFWEAGRCCKR